MKLLILLIMYKNRAKNIISNYYKHPNLEKHSENNQVQLHFKNF